MMSNLAPLDISRFPPHFHPQDGVLSIGDLHAHPLKPIQLLIHTRKITGLNDTHYQALYQIYSKSYELAEAYYTLEREHVTVVKELERSGPRLTKLKEAYEQQRLVDGKAVTAVQLKGAQTLQQQNQDKMTDIGPRFLTAKNAFLAHFRTNLPVFIYILKQMNPGDGDQFFRLFGDDIHDRGACNAWVQAVLKVAADKKIEFDILLSNHGVLGLLNDPRATDKLDSGKMQALSGIMMALVEKEAPDILETCGLTNFMQEIYFPRLKLGAYILREDGGIDIDYHAPVDLNDIMAQCDFLSIPADRPKTHQDLAKILDAISDRVRAYIRENRLPEIIAVFDFKRTSPEARAFIRKHNPINFPLWNRDVNDLDRPNENGMCWRHGHYTIPYKESHTQCLNSLFGQGDQLTQPADEKVEIFVLSKGQPSLRAEANLSPAPIMDIHRRLLMLISSQFHDGGLDEPYLFQLAEKLEALKGHELKPFLERDIRERTLYLRANGQSVEKSPHLYLLKQALTTVRDFEKRSPGLSFLWTLQNRVERDFGHFKKGRGLEKYRKLMSTIETLKAHPTAQPSELLHSMGTTLFQDLAYSRHTFHSSIADSAQRAGREFVPSEMKKQTLIFLQKLSARLKKSLNREEKLAEVTALIHTLKHTDIDSLEALCRLKADGHQHNLLSTLMMHRRNKPSTKETRAYKKFCEFFDLNEILGEDTLQEILQAGNAGLEVPHHGL